MEMKAHCDTDSMPSRQARHRISPMADVILMWTIALVLISEVRVIGAARAAGNPVDDQAGLANPAAVFCAERAGEYLLGSGQCRPAQSSRGVV